jgi:hypothetical protein
MAEEGSMIEINLNNPEQEYLYTSICEYVSSTISGSLESIKQSISCRTSKRKPENEPLFQKTQVTPQIYRPGIKKLTPSKNRIPTRTDTLQIIEPRIKKIPSNGFLQFLKSESDKEISKDIIPKNIFELNTEVILNLQNLSETRNGDTFRQNIQTPKIVPVHIPLAIISEMKETELEYINYTGRKLVVLNIPDESKIKVESRIIFNRDYAWCPNGGIGPSYPKSKICPFYLSTGKSNDTNFPGMWFPFFRIKTLPAKQSLSKMERGWIYKAWGLQSVKKLRERLNKRFNIPLPTEQETEDILYCLLEKFSHWWQIQLSLQLPIENGTLWETNPLLREFKKIVLNYDYDNFLGDSNCFMERNPDLKKQYVLTQPTVLKDSEPETINTWLCTRKEGVLNVLPIDSESRETPLSPSGSQSSQSSQSP